MSIRDSVRNLTKEDFASLRKLVSDNAAYFDGDGLAVFTVTHAAAEKSFVWVVEVRDHARKILVASFGGHVFPHDQRHLADAKCAALQEVFNLALGTEDLLQSLADSEKV